MTDPSNACRFVEHWAIPDFPPQDVYEVISDARLLPGGWKGVSHTAARPRRHIGAACAEAGLPAARSTRNWCASNIVAASVALVGHHRKRPLARRFCASQTLGCRRPAP